jgi:hypothetical protein
MDEKRTTRTQKLKYRKMNKTKKQNTLKVMNKTKQY